METVKKGKEPLAWKQYRTTPGVDYKATPQLSFALLKENGFVCAYCGRRIPCNDPISGQNDEDSNHTLKYRTDKMHIEHVYPREVLNSAAERMDYSNMVACCPGFIGDSGWQLGEVSLPLVKDDTPLNDPNSIELDLLSGLVADYSDKHYSIRSLS